MITFASGAIFGAVAFYLALRNNAKVKAKVPSEPVPGPYVVIVGCPGQIHMKTITQKQRRSLTSRRTGTEGSAEGLG